MLIETAPRGEAYGQPGATVSVEPGPTLERLMLTEQSHRVANDLAVLMSVLHGVKTRPEGGAARLDAAMDRVMALAQVQRLLIPPVAGGRRDVGDLVERVCRQMSLARLEPDGIALTVRADRCVIDGVAAWTVAVIIAELVSNAARHAFTGRTGAIHVEVRRAGGILVARVRDDGVGCGAHAYDCSLRQVSVDGVGSRIVAALTRAVGGIFKRVSSPGGTLAEVRLGIEAWS